MTVIPGKNKPDAESTKRSIMPEHSVSESDLNITIHLKKQIRMQNIFADRRKYIYIEDRNIYQKLRQTAFCKEIPLLS